MTIPWNTGIYGSSESLSHISPLPLLLHWVLERRQFGGAPSMGLANMSSTQSCGSSSISKPAVSDRNQAKHVHVSEFVLGTPVHYKHMQHVGPKATRSLITTTWYDNSRDQSLKTTEWFCWKDMCQLVGFFLKHTSTLRLTWLDWNFGSYI